jgi:hypothetical protein
MPYTYTLSETIPLARIALTQVNEFQFSQFVAALWMQLEPLKVDGVVRTDPIHSFTNEPFVYSHVPRQLRVVAAETFQFLLQNAFITPMSSDFPRHAPNGPVYAVSERGREWAEAGDHPVEDENGYIKHLLELVPQPDPVVLQYVTEGLRSFDRRTYLAAAVMLGAASDAAIYNLGDALLKAIQREKKRKELNELVDRRRLGGLVIWIGKFVADAKEIQRNFNGVEIHLMSLFDSIRIQRNDAVHPKTGLVSIHSLRLAFDAFPRAFQQATLLGDWLDANPGTF